MKTLSLEQLNLIKMSLELTRDVIKSAATRERLNILIDQICDEQNILLHNNKKLTKN